MLHLNILYFKKINEQNRLSLEAWTSILCKQEKHPLGSSATCLLCHFEHPSVILGIMQSSARKILLRLPAYIYLLVLHHSIVCLCPKHPHNFFSFGILRTVSGQNITPTASKCWRLKLERWDVGDNYYILLGVCGVSDARLKWKTFLWCAITAGVFHNHILNFPVQPKRKRIFVFTDLKKSIMLELFSAYCSDLMNTLQQLTSTN